MGLYTYLPIPLLLGALGISGLSNRPSAPKHIGEVYMRLGILISCANSDAQKMLDMIEGICTQHDAKLVFSMKTLNEIRLVEKKSEEIL